MNKYEVGQIIDNFKYHQEGVQFDISDDGATMIVFFQNPTHEEIAQFKPGRSFEIRFTELYKAIILTVKIGNLNWMDMPYSPHLSKNLTKFQIPNKGEGLKLTLILVNTDKGKVESIRLLGLSEQFTKKLFGIIMEQKIDGFDITEYSKSLDKIYSTYLTNQIVKLSKEYCRITS